MAVGFVGFVVGNSRGDDGRTKRQRYGSHSHPQIAIEQEFLFLNFSLKRIYRYIFLYISCSYIPRINIQFFHKLTNSYLKINPLTIIKQMQKEFIKQIKI